MPRIAWIMILWLTLINQGCTHLGQPGEAAKSPLKLVVGPVALDAAITKSTQIHSFDDPPSPETEATVLATLLDETQAHAQQALTAALARHARFTVVPFEDARRAFADYVDAMTPDESASRLASFHIARGYLEWRVGQAERALADYRKCLQLRLEHDDACGVTANPDPHPVTLAPAGAGDHAPGAMAGPAPGRPARPGHRARHRRPAG